MDLNKITCVFSKEDEASQTIKKAFVGSKLFSKTNKSFDGNPVYSYKNVFLIELNEQHLFSDKIESFESDVYLFPGRHSSKQGVLSFTVHSNGNPCGEAKLGGTPFTLSCCSSLLQKQLFVFLKKEVEKSNSETMVTFEATHHGPTLSKPALFIEIGSSEQEWFNEGNGKIIFNSIMNALQSPFPKNQKTALGFGGTHYCSEFVKLLGKDISFSFIFSKYAVSCLNEKVLQEAIDKTAEKIDFIVIDWKGCKSAERNKIIDFFEEKNTPFHKLQEIKKSNI